MGSFEVDGNNIRAFVDKVREARAVFEKPTVIIAHTIPGKGVDLWKKIFMARKAPNSKKQKSLSRIKNIAGKNKK